MLRHPGWDGNETRRRDDDIPSSLLGTGACWGWPRILYTNAHTHLLQHIQRAPSIPDTVSIAYRHIAAWLQYGASVATEHSRRCQPASLHTPPSTLYPLPCAMVARKPTSEFDLVPAPLSKANPPYPTTPTEERAPVLPSTPATNAANTPDPNKSPAFNFKTPDKNASHKEENLFDQDSDYSSDEDWDKSDDDADFNDAVTAQVPDSLKPAGGKAVASPRQINTLPGALRVGPPAGIPAKTSFEAISPMPTGASAILYGGASTISNEGNGSLPLQTNNPYLKMQTTGQTSFEPESGHNVWGDSHSSAQQFGGPAELPAYTTPDTPTHDMKNLNLDSHPSAEHKSDPQSTYPPQDSNDVNPWNPDGNVPPFAASSQTPKLPEPTPPDDQNIWEDQRSKDTAEEKRKEEALTAARTAEEMAERERRHAEESQSHASQPVPQYQSSPPQHAPQQDSFPPTYDTQHQASAPQHLSQHEQSPPGYAQQTPPSSEEEVPGLPRRTEQEEQPPPFPPRPVIATDVGAGPASGPETPTTAMNRQRKEHYQIKQIRWHDVNKPGIRTSPILTQNLNGPCPLLALVNALVLSTPSGIETALVETLRTREQVSLGLLLDAVFDELMSGRRGGAAQELPDVGDLYKFLLALHTGLNVNPMFVPDSHATHDSATLTSHPGGQAGGFENTADMKLYRTFNIPLMHGWLPEAGTDAYAAFERVANSYETSQYVQFQEEELDAKLQSGQPLNADEQQMFTDIHAIKEFLSRWPTQLTDHGLKTMRDSIQPGQVAILFRNDHFSTLFKDPRTHSLVTLVTDQGYSSHDEIVWESLVDVNGQGSELYSGDFRPVGNNTMPTQSAQQTEQSQQIADDGQGWTTVQGRRGNQQPTPSAAQDPTSDDQATVPGELSRAEQEDHDLALALQLQEEEEDRERRETERRQRENNDQASRDYIAAQSPTSPTRPDNRQTARPAEAAPVIPPRRNNITGYRPNEGPAPPPTYEEASTAPQYHPPEGHPASAQASVNQGNASGLPVPGGNPSGRRYSGRPSAAPNMAGRPGRRHSAGVTGANGEERDKCVVM
jgi:hypothetical protein